MLTPFLQTHHHAHHKIFTYYLLLKQCHKYRVIFICSSFEIGSARIGRYEGKFFLKSYFADLINNWIVKNISHDMLRAFFIMQGAQGEVGTKGERGDPGLPVRFIFDWLICYGKVLFSYENLWVKNGYFSSEMHTQEVPVFEEFCGYFLGINWSALP